jgi:hypothetical protein
MAGSVMMGVIFDARKRSEKLELFKTSFLVETAVQGQMINWFL